MSPIENNTTNVSPIENVTHEITNVNDNVNATIEEQDQEQETENNVINNNDIIIKSIDALKKKSKRGPYKKKEKV